LHQEVVKEITDELNFIPWLMQDIMEDPVLAADGNTYERFEIMEWLSVTIVLG
jgi:hypothetical protein